MARLIWAVLCRDAVIDKESNNIQLQQVLEQVNMTVTKPTPEAEEGGNEAPILPLEGTLVTLWARNDFEIPEATTMRLRLTCPDGHCYPLPEETSVDLTSSRHARIKARFNALPYHGSGEYDYIIEEYDHEGEDWRVVAVVPLDVQVTELGETTEGDGA